MDDSAKFAYDIILVQDILILTQWGLNLKVSDNAIEADDGTFKGSTSPMVSLGTYKFKDLNTGIIIPEE